jgi:phosphoribosylanthranilate isomerase
MIKVCGMKDQHQVTALQPMVDFIGFIFYEKSPRYVETTVTVQGAKKVGVFVNASIDSVKEIIEANSLDFVQLHGSESPEYCETISDYAKVIKAFGIHSVDDFEQLSAYENAVTYILFDTKTPDHGGSGRQFDWKILSKYTGQTPFILGGGINPEAVTQLSQIKHPKLIGLDLNSGFEIEPADKNIDQLKTFIHEIKNTALYSA